MPDKKKKKKEGKPQGFLAKIKSLLLPIKGNETVKVGDNTESQLEKLRKQGDL
ncbi:MAG: hypothetical protein V3S01_06880 [Dehalococcoidia bacterium]